MFGPLGQAERGGLRCLQHLAGTADKLARHQEWQQHVRYPGEFAGPHDQIILVASVGVACRVGVVLEQVDVPADALIVEPLLGVDEQVLQHPLARTIVGDELDQVVAFGGGVFGMAAHVEVQPRTVAQEYVRASAPGDHPTEQIAGDLVRAEPAVSVKCAGDTKLGFDAHDSALHGIEPTGSRTASVGKRAGSVAG